MEGGDLKFLLPSSAKSMIDDGDGREGPRGGDVGLHLVSRAFSTSATPPQTVASRGQACGSGDA